MLAASAFGFADSISGEREPQYKTQLLLKKGWGIAGSFPFISKAQKA